MTHLPIRRGKLGTWASHIRNACVDHKMSETPCARSRNDVHCIDPAAKALQQAAPISQQPLWPSKEASSFCRPRSSRRCSSPKRYWFSLSRMCSSSWCSRHAIVSLRKNSKSIENSSQYSQWRALLVALRRAALCHDPAPRLLSQLHTQRAKLTWSFCTVSATAAGPAPVRPGARPSAFSIPSVHCCHCDCTWR